jgi:molybdopterin/thiamine biosynthesis adenylyltransferase
MALPLLCLVILLNIEEGEDLDEKASFLSHRREDALIKMEYYLSRAGRYLKLTDVEEKGLDVWKTEYTNSDKTWGIHIVFPEFYPDELPEIKIINSEKLFLKNPHVGDDDYLCIIPDSSSFDSEDIVSVFEYLIKSAKEILDGTSKSDFQDEFDSYWNRNVSPNQNPCVLISSPENLESRCFAFIGEKIIYIANDEKELISWMKNISASDKNNFKKNLCFILRLDKPLLPENYPNSLYDVLQMIKASDREIYDEFVAFISNSNDYCFILLVQKNISRYSLGGILLPSPHLCKRSGLSDGFRMGHVPPNTLVNRATNILKNRLINRCKINRSDHNWIHSRGGDGKLLDKKKIVLLGCGSLGGYLAHYLAKTGIGNILLIDKDRLEFANIGRHILGGDCVGELKAIALAEKLKKEMPHLVIDGIGCDWRTAYKKNSTIFRDTDLIISTMADWKAEKPLNLLVRVNNLPSVIYAWLEPFAVAGHCFISISGSGCIECCMDSKGIFNKQVARFNYDILKRETGTCTYYQEYGPSALMPILSMIVSETIKYLSSSSNDSILSTWISDRNHFNDVSAVLTGEWIAQLNDFGYSTIYHNKITPNNRCKICSRI